MLQHAGGYDYLAEAGDPALPALVLLHGTGDDAASFMSLGRRVAPTATRLSVQGNVDENGMARFFRRRAMGVYDMADLAARTQAFAAFLDLVLAQDGSETRRAVGLGYSNGANLLANLALVRPEALPRLVLLHPLIPFELPTVDLAGIEVLITAGQRDPICPWPMTERLVGALQERGAEVAVVTHGGGHEIHPRELEEAADFIAR